DGAPAANRGPTRSDTSTTERGSTGPGSRSPSSVAPVGRTWPSRCSFVRRYRRLRTCGAVGSGSRPATTTPCDRSPSTLAGLLVSSRTERPRARALGGVVGQQPGGAHAGGGEHGGAVAVVAGVDRPTDGQVGVDGVGAPVLLDVGPELVDEPDPPPLVPGGVDEDATPGGVDGPQGEPELDAAVAAEGPEDVAGQALGVHPGDDVLATVDLAPGEGEEDPAVRALEGMGVEHAHRRRQGHGGHPVER